MGQETRPAGRWGTGGPGARPAEGGPARALGSALAIVVRPVAIVALGLAASLLASGGGLLSGGKAQGVVFGLVLAGLALAYWEYLWDFAGFLVRRPIQSGGLALIFAMVYGQVGNALGLPGLFWSEEPVTRYSVAMATTLVLALLGLNAYYTMGPETYGRINVKVRKSLRPEHGPVERLLLAALARSGATGEVVGRRSRFLMGRVRPLERAVSSPLRRFLRWIFVDTPGLDPPSPRRGGAANPYRVGRFLRLVRLPFLTLLAMPALLPSFFVFVPRTAPVVLDVDRMRLHAWAGWFRPDVVSDRWAYALGASLWLLGIWSGVLLVKAFILLSLRLSRGGGAAGADDPRTPQSVAIYAAFVAITYLTLASSPLYSGAWFGRDWPSERSYLVTGLVLLVTAPLAASAALAVASRPSRPRIGRLARLALVVGLIELFIFVPLGYGLSRIRFQGIAPAVAILALLGMVAVASALFGRYVRDPRLRLVGILAVLAVIGLNNHRIDGNRFEQLQYGRDAPARQASRPAAPAGPDDGPIPDRDALEAWASWCLATDPAGGPGCRPKLVVVCVSGGAIRSAYWSATVVDRIGREVGRAPGEAAPPSQAPESRPFDRHVRLIAGASGGMVGMPYYVRHLYDGLHAAGEPEAADALERPGWERDGGRRGWVGSIPPFGLRRVSRYIALGEVPGMFVRGLLRTRGDRGIELERDWEALRFPISALADAERAGKLPSLVFSPMTIEDGRRLLISNLDLSFPADPGLPPPGASDSLLALARGGALSARDDGSGLSPYSRSAAEFSKVFARRGGDGVRINDLYLSTAARMSATFPFVSPAVYLPTEPPLRVVDAGYYDNYGVDVATSWLFRNRVWIAEHTSGVLMVQVRDTLSVADRFEVPEAPDGRYARLLRGFQFFFSPMEGVARARYSSSSFRNDAQVAALSDSFAEQTGSRSFFTTAVFELAANLTFPGSPGAGDWPGDRLDAMLADADTSGLTDVAMSWYLTVAERQAIEEAIPDFASLATRPRGPFGAAVPEDAQGARPEFPGVGVSDARLEDAFGVSLPVDADAYRLAFLPEAGAAIPEGGIVAIDINEPAQRRFRVEQLRTLRELVRVRGGGGDRDQERLAVVTRALTRASSYEAIRRIADWWPLDQFGRERPSRCDQTAGGAAARDGSSTAM